MRDMRGTDMVVVGILLWLVWKEYHPESFLEGCDPSSMLNTSEPQSSLTGPWWTQQVEPVVNG